MSGDKDMSAPATTPGRARRTLGSLRTGWGRLHLAEGTVETPLRFVRESMGRRESWRWLSGKGPVAVFEMEREW
jgi:hypothetical protein